MLNLEVRPMSKELREQKEKLVREMREFDKYAKQIEKEIGMTVKNRAGIHWTIKE